MLSTLCCVVLEVLLMKLSWVRALTGSAVLAALLFGTPSLAGRGDSSSNGGSGKRISQKFNKGSVKASQRIVRPNRVSTQTPHSAPAYCVPEPGAGLLGATGLLVLAGGLRLRARQRAAAKD